MYIKVF